jgi:FAD/FMN-containing dehydrogenase/Fe-S oxidoreductase
LHPQIPFTIRPPEPVDSFPEAAELASELKRVIRGEVRFDRGSRALYTVDASNYRQIPIGIVLPRDSQDAIAAVAACRKYGAPVLSRGAGTSLAGQCCNVAVILDFSKYMNRIIDLDPGGGKARVEPGLVLDDLRQRAEPHQLTFAPDPSTHSRCTLGGMIGNNSCGTHSLWGGKTVDNIESLRVLLYDGTEITVGATDDRTFETILKTGGRPAEIFGRLSEIRRKYGELIRQRFPRIPRRVSGYNLDELLPENGFHVARALVGSEGTCVAVLEATVKLRRVPRHRALVGLGYKDAFEAADHIVEILELAPIGLEGMDGSIIEALKQQGASNIDLFPEGGGFLLVEFASDDADEVQSLVAKLHGRLQRMNAPPSSRTYSEDEARAVWRIRESGPRAAAASAASPEWEGWDDSAVAPEKLGPYLRDLRKLMNEYHYRGAFYGHFGHGCVHMRITFDLFTEDGVQKYREFIDRAADLVIGYGGSLSGEHGDGQSRGALLPKMYGPELMEALREFKTAWDPQNKMNPHKLIDAFSPIENLRLGPAYQALEPVTHFKFVNDQGSFAKAAERCIGVGACRKRDFGAMCPSYMATLEEEHSTRGRAHMLFEMLQGQLLEGGWENEAVKKALDLCLACKACKAECPVNVDMATYKAEFLSHYYETKRRPRFAYAFGHIDRWLRLASLWPRVANFLTHAPLVSHVLRAAVGISPQRQIPALSHSNFQSSLRKQRMRLPAAPLPLASPNARGKVVLWPDTFNNHFHPETCQAALDVLIECGFQPQVPPQSLCCGRPLYDFGMLDKAKAYLMDILEKLGPELDAGLPVVVLEPSCASVFRDELPNLLPREPRAERLRKQTLLFAEFLESWAPHYTPPGFPRDVLLHGHCHQKALVKMNADETLLRRMGANLHSLDSGCCGMAGPFGFERTKFALSLEIGERTLLPTIRRAPADTIIISDGFSCREQILQATGRRALHIAEALQLARAESHPVRPKSTEIGH